MYEDAEPGMATKARDREQGEVGALVGAIDRLDTVFADLVERLAPVLGGERPERPEPALRVPSSHDSQLYHQRARIDTLAGGVHELIARLEV